MESFSNDNSYGRVSKLISTVKYMKSTTLSCNLILDGITDTKIINWNKDVLGGFSKN